MVESDVHHHLAAILVADAVGYTRLMHDDEHATVAAIEACRAIFRDRIETNGGRVVDMAGDSVLAVFETATGAVRCAIDTQDALIGHNEPLPDERRMRFRVGVTLGEIIEKEDGSVYGDGVNIAARLQAEAEPDEINISGTVFDSVRGKIQSGFEDLGEHEVKNIDTPVRVYRVVAADTATPPRRARNRRLATALGAAVAILLVVASIGSWQAGWIGGGGVMSVVGAAQFRPALPNGPSIAVLPFANLSGDPEQEYFSDGLTEDVIAALGRFSDLSVLARNATLRFKGEALPPEEIGRDLGVGYLLEGSVRRAGSQIRVSAQLIDATTGQHLWSSRYDNEFEDLFSVQDDITRNVAGALAVELTRVESDRAINKPTEDLRAYDYVLRGLNLLRRGERSANFQARELFERAIKIDPSYAAAYTSLGTAHLKAIWGGYTEFVGKNIEQAEALAEQSLALDSKSVRALRLLGLLHLQKGEYDRAARQLRRALEINPSDAESYKAYGAVLLWSGHEKKAVEWLQAALQLDPNRDMEHGVMADLEIAYYLSGRYEDAVAAAQETLRRHHNNYPSAMILAAANAQLGRHEEAAQAAQELLRIYPFFTINFFTAQLADPDDADHLADGLRKAGLDIPNEPSSAE